MNIRDKLLKKIQEKNALVGIIGLGYVGLPLAIEFARAGFTTLGFDINSQKADKINRGENYIADVGNDELSRYVSSGALSATTEFSRIKGMDFLIICVPTPLDVHQQPDIDPIRKSVEDVAKHLKPESVIVLESTTYPGTTEEIIKPILERDSGLVCGKDFYLGFSPERVDPGNLHYNTNNTPKVVGAIGKDALDVISFMYESVLSGGVKRVSSTAVAEMEKILENTYRNVNIGLVNELAIFCNVAGINIWEVIEAAKTKPYGFQAFYPGPGLGGHCIPLDPYYLSWKAREYGFHTSMIETSMIINDRMPEYCVERAAKILNKYKKPLNGSKVLLLGVAYKPDIDDYRESPALKVMEKLLETGAVVDYYDPYISLIEHRSVSFSGLDMLDKSVILLYDLVIITTAHTNVDYDLVAQNSQAVFDTKNAMKNVNNRSRIELL